MASDSQRAPQGSVEAYERIANSDEFAVLRRAYRGFVIPATVAFLVWYFTYVVLSIYAHDFMSTQLVGHINLALVLGLLQFVSTFLLAYLYSRYAAARLDPLATEIEREFGLEEGR